MPIPIIAAIASLFAGGGAAAAGGAAAGGAAAGGLSSGALAGAGGASNLGFGASLGNMSNILGQQGTAGGFGGMGPSPISGMGSTSGPGGLMTEPIPGQAGYDPATDPTSMSDEGTTGPSPGGDGSGGLMYDGGAGGPGGGQSGVGKDMSDWANLPGLFGMMNQINRSTTPRARMDRIQNNPYIQSLMGG